MGRVSGKVAIVTGAARGMGAAFAQLLAREGAKVVLTDVLDREGHATAQVLGDNALFLHHDVAREEDWKRVVGAAESVFGPVSVLVNNAGIIGYGAIETMTEAEFRRVIDVNLVGVFLGMKSVVPSMKSAGGGSIINLSSVGGLVGIPHALAYSAAKAAVRGMSKAAAVELAGDKIRVNSVHPGFIRTPMTALTPENEAVMAAIAAVTPARRVGDPEEVASVVLLLASDESLFSTGAEFVIDGGYTCQ